MAEIAVLEDNALMRRYLADLLGQVGGHSVRAYAEPTEMAFELEKAPAQLVVLDIGLGPTARLHGQRVDGIAVCQYLKAQPSPPAVMLLTAHAFDGDEVRFLEESGADAYEPKPIRDEDGFLEKLGSLLT